MTISREEVQHIALLSRLYLSDEEVERYTRELDAILRYVEMIRQLDTGGVPPTSHAIEMVNVMRPDRIEPSLRVEEALANAPDKEPPFFRVPRIVE